MNTTFADVAIRDAMVPVAPGQNFFRALNNLGLTSFELLVEPDGALPNLVLEDGSIPFSLNDIPTLKARLEDERVQVCALLLGTDFSSPNIGAEIAWSVTAIRAAHELDVPAVRLDPLTFDTSITPEKIRENVIRGVREVLRQTEGTGVDIGLENHGAVANRPEFMEAIFEELNDPRVGITLDTGNYYWSGLPLDNLYEVIARLAPHAKHTHMKSIQYPVELRDQQRSAGYEYLRYAAPVNEGDIDMSRIVGILRDAGYIRPLCIENEMLHRVSAFEQVEILRQEISALAKSHQVPSDLDA